MNLGISIVKDLKFDEANKRAELQNITELNIISRQKLDLALENLKLFCAADTFIAGNITI